MSTYTAGYFVGSLARGSINRKLAHALTRLAPPHLHMREIPIGELPLYSYDYDSDYPPPARALKEAIAAVDAVLSTAEFLRGYMHEFHAFITRVYTALPRDDA